MAQGMWGTKLALLVVGLLVMVPETMQLNVDHPLFGVVQKINFQAGPFLGLVISSGRYEKLLKNSTFYTPDEFLPSLVIAGRKFNIGKFNNVPAIYVVAQSPLANVGVTTQILIDTFRVSGVISLGAAASVSNILFISNVIVPSQVTYTGSWKWEKYNAVQVAPGFAFGSFNLPEVGENSLASVEYTAVPIYKATSSNQKKSLNIDVHKQWVDLAVNVNWGQRLTVNIGGKVGSSDVYLKNKAYGNVLNDQLGVSAVDTESAAVVTTAIANGVPHIVFRGASNRPGSDSSDRLSTVTALNVLKAVAKFVEAAFPLRAAKYSIV